MNTIPPTHHQPCVIQTSTFSTLSTLETSMEKADRDKYHRRFCNGYDVPGDTQYYHWKLVYIQNSGHTSSTQG